MKCKDPKIGGTRRHLRISNIGVPQMIILINGTGDTVWLPVYTLNSDMDPLLLVLGSLELISYLITGLLVLKTCKIIHKSRNFHQNMNLLMIILIGQWFEAFFAKLLIMPYQVGFLKVINGSFICWWTADNEEMIKVSSFFSILPLFLPGMLIWHYVYSMFMGVTCVGVERIFATIYVRDYEKTPRKYISITLLFLVHGISFPFSYFMTNNRINFIIADCLCIGCVILICPMYLSIWYINYRLGKKFAVPGGYRLAQQFQVKENIRHIMLARNIVCCATFFVAIACGLLMIIVLDMIPIWLKNPLAHCVENCIFLNPLLICGTMLLSVPPWKKEFIGSIPFLRKFRNEESRTGRDNLRPADETEVYFNQFKNAWMR